jgi:hypothetical protein
MRSNPFLPSIAAAAAALLVTACTSPGSGASSGGTYPDGTAGTISIDGSAPRAVTMRYGQNYWSWGGYGNNMPRIQSLVAPLRLDLLRAGGYNNDAEKSTGTYGSDPFGQAQIDAFVAYCAAVGAEPIIQVPLIDSCKKHGGSADPADAAALVHYANVTKGYKVKYWEIGNEPDLYGDVNNGVTDIPGYSLTRFIADFKAFASAMKAVDPGIQILGPELSWKYYPRQARNSANDWLTPFVDQCKGYYDVIAIHRYPFDAAHCTIPNAMADVDDYVSMVRAIQDLLGTYAPGVPFAITEANISWDGDPSHSIYPASPQTIFAAIWVADILGAAREEGLWAQHFWSLSESWTLGFVDPSTVMPRPEYHGFQLVSAHMGPTELSSTPAAGFSVYASRSAADDATIAIVLNKHASNDAETFAFSGMSGTPAAGFTTTFPAYSISAVIFPDGGGAPAIYRYSGTEAAAGSGPVQVQ